MTTQTEDFRRQPPAPLPPRALNLPLPEETTLENGLRVVVVEHDRLPLVSFRLAFPTGDAFDPAELPGLADTLTSMLTEGTESRTSRQIAEEAARLGATLNAGATSDYTTVAASSLSDFSDSVLELLADVSLRPSFPENELALAKANAQQNLIAQRAQPSFLSTEAVTRERLLEEHRARFVPNNAVLFAVGDVRRDRFLARAEELFGGWRAG